jgi:hypothetical protein
MKELKREFDLTKEQVEENLRLMPYHRKFVQASVEMPKIRNDQSINRHDKRKMLKAIRDDLTAEWKRLNE